MPEELKQIVPRGIRQVITRKNARGKWEVLFTDGSLIVHTVTSYAPIEYEYTQAYINDGILPAFNYR